MNHILLLYTVTFLLLAAHFNAWSLCLCVYVIPYCHAIDNNTDNWGR